MAANTSYLFILCGPIVHYLLPTNFEIKGKVFGTEEMKIAQFSKTVQLHRLADCSFCKSAPDTIFHILPNVQMF